MNMELINKIEERISELEKRAKEVMDFSNNATANIKRLKSEKAKALDESNVIAGAVQAFKGVLAEVSEKKEEAPLEAKKEPASKKEKNV